MKMLLVWGLLGVCCGLSAQTSRNVTLLDRWFSDTLLTNSSLARFSDCVGYVDSLGREYAFIGSTEGIHAFLITEDNRLQFIDFIQGKFAHPSVVHRDLKIYKHYLFAVCDEGDSDLQIIDLSHLPDSMSLAASITNNLGRVHNLFLDEENERMFACRVTTLAGGVPTFVTPLRVFSLADPLNPSLIFEGFPGIVEVHDAFVKGQIAYLNCGFDGLRVYDFTNPSTPVLLQNLSSYQDQGYNHQGWLTPDGTRFIFGDETEGRKVKLFEVGVDHTLSFKASFGTAWQQNSVAHNIEATDDLAFVAYYNQGLRIFNLNDGVKEIAHYDTYLQESAFQLNGAWGIFSRLPSKRLLVSDRQNGLFLLGFDRDKFKFRTESLNVYPSPANTDFVIQLPYDSEGEYTVKIYNGLGKLVYSKTEVMNDYVSIQGNFEAGTYEIRVETEQGVFRGRVVVLNQ